MVAKKNILIVGVSSLVGMNLALELKKEFKVYGTYFKNSKTFKNKKNFFKINLKSKNPFKHINKNIFHSVIWCVNDNNKKKSFNNYFQLNILGIIKLMNFLSLKNLDKFIFFSTGSVYSASKKKINENSKINLNDDYSLTKYFGEKICEVYKKIFKFKLIILRPFTIYGNGQKDKLIFNLISKIKNNKKIYIDGKEGRKLSCTNVKDISIIVKSLILNFKRNFALYNIASPYSYSILEFCNIISNRLNKNVKIINNKNKVYDYVSDTNILMSRFKFIKFENYIERNL